MYLKGLLRLRQTLAFRLTLWYAGIFTLSSCAAFSIFYLRNISLVQDFTDQELLNERTEFASLLSLKGIETVKNVALLEAESEGVDTMFYRILTKSGGELAVSDMSSWGNLRMDRAALKQLEYGIDHVFQTLDVPGREHKVRVLYATIGPDTTLQVGLSLKENAQILQDFQRIFIATMGALILLAALIGWFMAKWALSGVEEVTRTAQHIARGALEERVLLKGRGLEIEELANTFNGMLDRIHGLIIGMREMTDNIAHDLKSPITRIRGIAEMTLTTGKSMDECKAMAANTIEESDRLLEMINTMLDISEAEAGASKLGIEKVDIVDLIREACDVFQPAAEDKRLEVVSNMPESSYIFGDKQKLQRMVANLFDNALKYTGPGGAVTLSVDGDEKWVIISIHDTGIGISKDDLPNVFTRFYRCDQSRSEPGIGLGLSLALAIARGHSGDITAKSDIGKGSTFMVSFPRKPLTPSGYL